MLDNTFHPSSHRSKLGIWTLQSFCMTSRRRCVLFLVLWGIQLHACAARGRSAFTTHPPAFKIPRQLYPAQTTVSPVPWPSPNTPKSSLLLERAVCIWYVACFNKIQAKCFNSALLKVFVCVQVSSQTVQSTVDLPSSALFLSTSENENLLFAGVFALCRFSYINSDNRVELKPQQIHWTQ